MIMAIMIAGCHPRLFRLFMLMVTAGLAVPARAQTKSQTAPQLTPPQPMPAVPDEPLPEWHPPPKKIAAPIYLTIAPEMVQAQRGRQLGMWISAIGWAQFLAAGILYVRSQDTNTILDQPVRIIGADINGNTLVSTQPDPSLYALRDRLQNAALAEAIIGGTMALSGFVVFSLEQARISKFHKRRPHEPLPALSGF
jgi:hypothetical protein